MSDISHQICLRLIPFPPFRLSDIREATPVSLRSPAPSKGEAAEKPLEK